MGKEYHAIAEFQSTLPVWGATIGELYLQVETTISIHAPRVGSDSAHFNRFRKSNNISIHAPRVGSDTYCRHGCGKRSNFNPRSPCGERRQRQPGCRARGIRFQSTLPVWGATLHIRIRRQVDKRFQSTLPVWGATRYAKIITGGATYFNPRSPCGERPVKSSYCPRCYAFQSTLPVWGATLYHIVDTKSSDISIHAPRVGSDKFMN